MCDADEFIGEISAAGAENTREISAVRFQEFLDRRILLHFLDRLPSTRKVRLLPYRWKSECSPIFRLLHSCKSKAGLYAHFRREDL